MLPVPILWPPECQEESVQKDVYKRQTIYSVSKLIDLLYFVLIYTQKGLVQWPSYRGEGILATVVKQKNTAV